MINVRNLSYRYRHQSDLALSDISLDIPQGSLFGLLGPNGSGKSTFIHILNGLLNAGESEIRINDCVLKTDKSSIQSFTSLVPQEYAFYPSLTISENLSYFASIQNIDKANSRKRISSVIDICQLQGFVKKRAAQCSGGVKRRLNLAIGLLNKPQILYLDEPTVGIDPQSRAFILESIKSLRDEGVTVVYTSHYMEEVEQLCDHIAIIDNGKVLAKGSTVELLGRADQKKLTVVLDGDISQEHLSMLALEYQVKLIGNFIHVDEVEDDDVVKVVNRIKQLGYSISTLKYGSQSLEQLFLSLTHRELRDV